MSAERHYSDLAIYRRLLAEARPYWRHIAGVLVLSVLAAPLALLTPLPLKIAVDSVVGEDPLPGFIEPLVPSGLLASPVGLLSFAAVLVVAIALLTHLQSLADTLLRTYTGEKLVLRFRARLFRHAQRLSLSHHDRAGTTDAVYRIQYDAQSIQAIAVEGITPFLTAGLTLVGMVWVTALINLQLALIALLVAPLLIGLTWWFRDRLRGQWRDVKKLEHSAFSVAQETLGALRVVKAFGQEGREQDRFEDRYRAGVAARVRVMAAEGGFGLLVGVTMSAGTAAVLFVGVRQVLAGGITLGELLVVLSYIGQMYGPLKTLGTKVAALQRGLASAERAFTFLALSPEVEDRPNARPLRRAAGEVELQEVSFSYDGRAPALREVSFRVPPGARVGIAGKTGAGKTTLVNLLTRFYDPEAGRILLDGTDLRDYRLADLRNQFAIVLQEPVLFSTSVAENIAYARPEASAGEIEAAARAANIHDFLSSLPEGYDTLVGERGMMLSGGERQRISLARAFLKDAPILILDEPTSSVDMKTEASIMDAMRRLMRGRTTFMIAHRLSTLEGCGLILVLEDGRLVEASSEVKRVLRTTRTGAGPVSSVP